MELASYSPLSYDVNSLKSEHLSDTIPPVTLNDRVRHVFREEKKRRDLSERDLAGFLNWSQSKVAQKLSGRTPITLDEFEAFCFALSVSPAEAIRDRGLEFYAEMTPTELRVLEHFRRATDKMREAIATILGVRLKHAAPERHAVEAQDRKTK